MKSKVITICFFFIASAVFSQRYYIKSALGHGFALPGESIIVAEADLTRKIQDLSLVKSHLAGGNRFNIALGARINDDFALEFGYTYQRSETQEIIHEELIENNGNYYILNNQVDFFSYVHHAKVSLRIDKNLGDNYTVSFLAGPTLFRGNMVKRIFIYSLFYNRSDLSSEYTFGAHSALILERKLGPLKIYLESMLDVNHFVPKKKTFLKPDNKYPNIYYEPENRVRVSNGSYEPININNQLNSPQGFVSLSFNLGIRYNFYNK